MKKILSFISSLAITSTMFCGMTFVQAKDYKQLPTAFSAPTNLTVYEQGTYNKTMYVNFVAAKDFLDFALDMSESYWGDVNGEDTNDDYWHTPYGLGIYYNNYNVQVDYKIDGGSWHYDSSWDADVWPDNLYDGYSEGFDGKLGDESQYNYVRTFQGEYVPDEGNISYENRACFTTSTDGDGTYYKFDTANHKVSFRLRYIVELEKGYYDGTDDNEETVYILSPWSETASYGQGAGAEYEFPEEFLEAKPEIENIEIKTMLGYANAPTITYTMNDSASILALDNPPKQYNKDINGSVYLKIETSLDGINWLDYDSYGLESKKHDMDFYDLWDNVEGNEGTFEWAGGTMYARAKYVFNGYYTIDNNIFWVEDIQSNWSDVAEIFVKSADGYSVVVHHDEFGYGGEGTKSFSRTENAECGWINCDPVQGCYVDTVVIDGVIMYDHDDAATHSLLEWWDEKEFRFLESDPRYLMSKDVTMEITYGGTPTAKRYVTVSYGKGGGISPSGDAQNKQLVYEGASKTFSIVPDGAFNIDTVKIDGVANAQAKADGSYTFSNITADHTIDATFTRWAWEVMYSRSSNGTVECSVADFDDYLAIGEDLTLTFTPDAEHVIEYVEINGVKNDLAKAEGKFAITDIDKNYNIYVKFSDTPVVTHTVHAVAGDNGNISYYGQKLKDCDFVVEDSEKFTVNFIPDEGYKVKKVTVDGDVIDNIEFDYYVLTNVTADMEISVTFESIEKPFVLGDVNGDTFVDIMDVVLTRAYIVGNQSFSEDQLARGDMSGDSMVNISDVVQMRKLIVG